jgi:L-alanine-DL-glutamate epimerase-like enolase superfamily enzyme
VVRGAGVSGQSGRPRRGAPLDRHPDRDRRERADALRIPRFIAAGAVDILQPDLAIAGGITECQRICALAAAHELTVAPHLWGSAILFAAGLHLCVATPCATVVEFSRGENPLLHELVAEPFDLQDGAVLAPERPGLGLTLRRDFVRSITVA